MLRMAVPSWDEDVSTFSFGDGSAEPEPSVLASKRTNGAAVRQPERSLGAEKRKDKKKRKVEKVSEAEIAAAAYGEDDPDDFGYVSPEDDSPQRAPFSNNDALNIGGKLIRPAVRGTLATLGRGAKRLADGNDDGRPAKRPKRDEQAVVAPQEKPPKHQKPGQAKKPTNVPGPPAVVAAQRGHNDGSADSKPGADSAVESKTKKKKKKKTKDTAGKNGEVVAPADNSASKNSNQPPKAPKQSKREREAAKAAQLSALRALVAKMEMEGGDDGGDGDEDAEDSDEAPAPPKRPQLPRSDLPRGAGPGPARRTAPPAGDDAPLFGMTLGDAGAARPPLKKKGQTSGGVAAKAEEKLMGGARFRWLNEQLYTTSADDAVRLFADDASLFGVYHAGFRKQVETWPANPVDVIIEWLATKPPTIVVADLGCGEAKIADEAKQKVLSFDLVAANSRVTACDIAHLPLGGKSVDVAVFCLSLMGTNFVDFLLEAHRVLKSGGTLKIAEVTSRFASLESFVTGLQRLGFDHVATDDSNKVFVLFEFRKAARPPQRVALKLRPCLYKRR